VVTPARVLAGVLIIAPFIALLWVSGYAKKTPTFADFPFFYWYQLMWVFITAGLTWVAYRLVRADERARRHRRDVGDEVEPYPTETGDRR
jgi:membrane protein implicated in regulation of membrane protease activity